MPARFLQIRTRGRGSPRILRLSGQTVRIGRSPLCEARVDDSALSDVECLLRLTGETWHLQPLSRSGRVAIDGRTVEHLRAVASNVPIRVGEATLTLRDHAEANAPFGGIDVPTASGPGSSARAVVARDDSDERLGDRPYVAPVPRTSTVISPLPGALRASFGESSYGNGGKTARSTLDAFDSPRRSSDTEASPATRRPTPAERMWQARWKAVGRALRATGKPQVVDEPTVVPFTSTKIEAVNSIVDQVEPYFVVPDPRIIDHADPESSDVVRLVPHEDIPDAIVPPQSPISQPSAIQESHEDEGVASSEVHWAIPDPSSEPVAVASANVPVNPGDDLRSRTEVVDLGLTMPPSEVTAEPILLSASPRKPRATRTVLPRSSANPPRPTPNPPRQTANPSRSSANPPRPAAPAPTRPTDDPAWPSVQSLLSRARPEPVQRPTRVKPLRSHPTLTSPRKPSGWSIPTWLALPACLAAIAIVGSAGVFFALAWGADDREAGILADRLLAPGGPRAIAEADVNPEATWWKTTSNHLATKATALGATKGSREREESAQFLLDSARAVAPLEPATRLARAEIASRGSKNEPLLALGLSRDAASLALTARVLARDGKSEPALAAYRSALSLAAEGGDLRGGIPPFVDTPEAHRFALPSETMILDIVREMAGQPGWRYATWSTFLPDHGLVLLATYRVLRERGEPEAESSLNRLVDSADRPSIGSIGLHVAAKAEGMALKRRAEDGASLYAEAIALAADDITRRAWHLNRALILARSGEREKANDAMMAARAGRGDDLIGRRVAESLKQEGLVKSATTAAAPGSGAFRRRAN